MGRRRFTFFSRFFLTVFCLVGTTISERGGGGKVFGFSVSSSSLSFQKTGGRHRVVGATNFWIPRDDYYNYYYCYRSNRRRGSSSDDGHQVSFLSSSSFQLHNGFQQRYHPRLTTTIQQAHSSAQLAHDDEENPSSFSKRKRLLLAPLSTLIASLLGFAPISQSLVSSTIGQILPLQISLAILMLSMGLTITPQEIQSATTTKQPIIVLGLNAICCFGIMPLLAWIFTKTWQLSPNQTIGTILLGCVSGGQASNLFTLLAGGDVALSVICTLSTTLLGVVATPLLIQFLLATTVPVQVIPMLRSVVSLVLIPLTSGLVLGRFLLPESILTSLRKLCPSIGLAATMILVAGGASNACLMATNSLHELLKTIGVSFLLPIAGGLVAWIVAMIIKLKEPPKRALVIEVLSKSPTLAHVLALRHFGVRAASIPAVSMVSLALLGALVVSIWQAIDPQ